MDTQKIVLKDNSKRAKIVIQIFWLTIIIAGISWLSNYFYLKSLEEILETQEYDEMLLDIEDIRQGIILIFFAIIYITSIVVFLNWFRRAYGNLKRLQLQTRTTEKMTIWYWFIPILSLFKPYQIMVEIWDKTQRALKNRDREYEINTNHSLIIIWWITFLVTNYIETRNFRKILKLDDSLESLIISTQHDMLSDLLIIPEAFLVIVIVWFLSKRERKLFNAVNKIE